MSCDDDPYVVLFLVCVRSCSCVVVLLEPAWCEDVNRVDMWCWKKHSFRFWLQVRLPMTEQITPKLMQLIPVINYHSPASLSLPFFVNPLWILSSFGKKVWILSSFFLVFMLDFFVEIANRACLSVIHICSWTLILWASIPSIILLLNNIWKLF